MSSPSGILTIAKPCARRFLLIHQGLLPPHKFVGKTGILDFISKIGCIQFDPVNIVGRNPDLVLNARVKEYRSMMLEDLLYKDFRLFDAWDKQASICLIEDWPYFTRHRDRMKELYWNQDTPESRLAPLLLEKINHLGHENALKDSKGEHINGFWGFPVRVERAALETLLAVRKIHIIRRINSRRIFDLVEKVLPAALLNAPDPNRTIEDYHDWHVLRRMGSLGLVQPGASDFWLGITGMKSQQRQRSIHRLVDRGLIIPVMIKELPGQQFYMRAQDEPEMQAAQRIKRFPKQAAFLPPLDNLLWDRKLLRSIFDFDYVWEIYKKPQNRGYGCYTMPVLFGDRLIARFEPLHDRKLKLLTVRNWWWEKGAETNEKVLEAIDTAFGSFCEFLQADRFNFHPEADFPRVSQYL